MPARVCLAHNVVEQSSFEPIEVSYCVDPDWLPYEAIRNGQHVGISADYLRIISEHSNIAFNLIHTDSWEESLDALAAGTCEVTVMLNQTPERLAFIDFTEPYFEQANVFVTNKSMPFLSGYDSVGENVLGLVRNYRHAEYVARYYPELTIKLVNNETEGMLMLASGELDVFVGSLLSVTSRIQRLGLLDLKVAGLAKPHDVLRMGAIKGSPQVIERLNAAIRTIDESQHVEIFQRWNNIKVIDEVDYRYVYAMLGVFLLFIALMIWRNQYVTRFNRKLMTKNDLLESLQEELLEKNKALEFLSTHDQLTELHNRHYMLQRCEEEIHRSSRFESSSCLIIIDIDFFKQINDKHGHSTGDLILKELTTLIKNTIREIDVISRWGGEEFLVLCPETNMTEANALAVRLNNQIEAHAFIHVGRLTCSFGVAEYVEGESFVQWFDRADGALYEAKSAGRNKIFIAQ